MQELLLVNPSRRPTKRRKTRKAASPAQKRVRAAFAAKARARSGTKRRKSTRRRAASPALLANPRKRSVARKSSRRRRNPSPRVSSLLKKPFDMLKPALIGAVGAIAVNNAIARLPLPAALVTGRARYVTQAVTAVALAALAQKFGMKGAMAAQAAEGSLTVTVRDAILDLAASAGMPLAGLGYYLPGMRAPMSPARSNSAAQTVRLNGMNAYVSGPGSPRAAAMPMRGIAKSFSF